MPRRIPLEPDTDLHLQQRRRHGIGGCAKNRIALCVLDEPRRYARATQICAVGTQAARSFPNAPAFRDAGKALAFRSAVLFVKGNSDEFADAGTSKVAAAPSRPSWDRPTVRSM